MNDVGVLSRLLSSTKPKRPSPARYNGYLDGNNGLEAFGWAYDAEQPGGGPVQVECFLGEQLVATVMADQPRPDLVKVGLPTHAFRWRLPANTAGPLSVRIKDSEFILHGSPMERKPLRAIGLVAGDIVNQCNLRCPFCIVDYSEVGSLKTMSADTFAQATRLMATTEPGNFWLSCLHEPTLHPRFIDLIETVPEHLRDRISFTTNLAKRLPDEFFRQLANSRVHHIRVSFDTRQPDVFAELRKKGRYEVFERNLLQLCAALKEADHPPGLHLITMAFTSNYREIPEMIRFGRDLGATTHEVRFVYYMPHIAEWGRKHVLNSQQWAELEAALEPLRSPTLLIGPPTDETRQSFEEGSGLESYQAPEAPWGGPEANPPIVEAEQAGRQFEDDQLRLRLRWDGLMISDRPSENAFIVNVNSLNDPFAYFETIRAVAAK